MRLLKSFLRHTGGNVAMVFGFALLPLSLASGVALDYNRASQERGDMVQALDYALIAAAREKDPAKRESLARKVYAANAKSTGRTNDTLTFWTASGGKMFYGRAESSVPTTLMKLASISTVPVSTEQAVNLHDNPVCLYLLKPTGTALTMRSSAEIKMPGCEVHVKSTSSDAVELNSNSKVSASELCVAGDILYKSAPALSNYTTKCDPIDELPKVPTVSGTSACTYDGKKYSSSATITEGTICNGMEMKNGTLTLSPGFYRVRGGSILLTSSGSLIAEGVTFYFEDEFSFIDNKANVNVRVIAPTSGTYRGIAMFENPALAASGKFSNVELNSSANTLYQGLFYLPSRNITMNSSSSILSKKMTLIGYSATFNSSSEWAVDPVPEEDMRLYDTRVALAR